MSRYIRLLRIASHASPELLERCEKAIYPQASRALRLGVLTDAQLERILRELVKQTGVGLQTIKRSYRRVAESDPQLYAALPATPYEIRGGGVHLIKVTERGPQYIPLTNFSARIVEECVQDDGLERTRIFKIEGQLADGSFLTTLDVGAAEFSSMAWITPGWGSRAVLVAGQGTKDHVRTAIQHFSKDVKVVTTYAHLGWRYIGGKDVYLHLGGAIDAYGPVADIHIDLPQGLEHFILPAPREAKERSEAVRASLELLNLAPDELIVPLLALPYRAVLGDADFSVHIVGETGVGKSEFSALAQQHFGAGLDSRHLPGSWSATANSLEELAFVAKDALLAVDDFAPEGSVQDIARLNGTAARLFRAQGNGSARSRMRADGTLRAPRPPRGMILSTGEDVPRGHSIRARSLVLEMEHGTLDWKSLGKVQERAREGLYAAALASFICRLAANLNGYQATFENHRKRFREDIFRSGHRRTADAGAQLLATWTILLDFATEVGAIDIAEREVLWGRVKSAILNVLAWQSAQQADSDPVTRFRQLLADSLASGRVHVRHYETGGYPGEGWGWERRDEAGLTSNPDSQFRPKGTLVGWVEADNLYLIRQTAFAEMQRFAAEQQTTVPVTQTVLWKRLADRGLLASRDGRHLTVQRQPHNAGRQRVLHLSSSIREKVGQVGRKD